MDSADFSSQNIGVDFYKNVWYFDSRNQNKGGESYMADRYIFMCTNDLNKLRKFYGWTIDAITELNMRMVPEMSPWQESWQKFLKDHLKISL